MYLATMKYQLLDEERHKVMGWLGARASAILDECLLSDPSWPVPLRQPRLDAHRDLLPLRLLLRLVLGQGADHAGGDGRGIRTAGAQVVKKGQPSPPEGGCAASLFRLRSRSAVIRRVGNRRGRRSQSRAHVAAKAEFITGQTERAWKLRHSRPASESVR